MNQLINDHESFIQSEGLQQLLVNIGIPDISKYVDDFHYQTDDQIIAAIEEITNKTLEDGEQTSPMTSDMYNWLEQLRPFVEESLGIDLPDIDEKSSIPTDLPSLLQKISPKQIHQINTNNDVRIEPPVGNISSWLQDWTRNLGRDPPTSLESWLQGFVPSNLHENLSDKSSSKDRLNSHLNKVQQVLSEHGYDVSNSSKTTTTDAKISFLGNFKNLYFLWKALDKNHDQQITVDDFEILLQGMGLNFLSKSAAATLFNIVDTNHDGKLQFRDFLALMSIVKKLLILKNPTNK